MSLQQNFTNIIVVFILQWHYTALMYISDLGYVEMARVLLKNGADLDIPNKIVLFNFHIFGQTEQLCSSTVYF